MYHFVPGYGMMGPAFYRNRSNIPPVAPVVFPAHPGPGAGGAAPGAWAGGTPSGAWSGAAPAGAPAPTGRQMLAAPAAGSPLAALAGTSLAPALADLIARAPQVAGALTGGDGNGGFPPDIPGMPKMPGPPPGMFTPGSGGLGGSVAPVQVPDWFLAQQAGGFVPAARPAGPGAG